MKRTHSGKTRIVTAASLYDGHDAAINIMRRILQSKGAEIIHLGHNRSVQEIVECAIEEDAHGIAITSYQGGHIEFFKYMKDLLDQAGCGHIRIFGGGGGTILPSEIETLHKYGIARIYSPDDGRAMGLEGMIEDVIQQCQVPEYDRSRIDEEQRSAYWKAPSLWNGQPPLNEYKDIRRIARAITLAEEGIEPSVSAAASTAKKTAVASPVLGITGAGGSGKSSVTDEIVRRFLRTYDKATIAVISVDPSKKKTGGALLGDRIRMNAIAHPRAYMRSLATREDNTALSAYIRQAIAICKAAGYDLIIVESAGVGQSDTAILDFSDTSLYVMTPEYGAASQLEKINMLDYADLIALNKSDKPGALDALHDVRKQYKRNHQLWDAKDEALPVVATIASQFNDAGVNELFQKLMDALKNKFNVAFDDLQIDLSPKRAQESAPIIPPKRIRYLSEIAENNRNYDRWVDQQSAIASKQYQLEGARKLLQEYKGDEAAAMIPATESFDALTLDPACRKLLDQWPELHKKYEEDVFEYAVRGKKIRQEMKTKTLSGTKIPKVMLPRYKDWGDILRWQLQENVPGAFPYTAGVFELKREGEDPTRMFAGEGGPERTNKRFHYVSAGLPAIRLSTAFDSVTLYGEDPDKRPDIYGKIGNSGVSIATVDDAKKLYSGFDLCDSKSSVSMTINGPAPMILAFFLNAAIDQQCEKYIEEHGLWPAVETKAAEKFAGFTKPVYHNPAFPGGHPVAPEDPQKKVLGLGLLGLSGDEVLPPDIYNQLKASALKQVRGTVQADILKEDQAQNTCIFSSEFALKLMGDVQQYFIDREVRNFYSVSISGYHIAEAGANPITQLAFTLANGFTYLEYYLSRGMHIDDFAPNLSFFFSNGMDAEYSVIGRVARRIWAKATKYLYKGNERSQKLKYHIQTSGRSLHAQEIDFNDIRTTLQALYAIYDNCNSLHTNAYDEAITTPTEESVRRAMAIQLIINREFGTAKNENPNQGSFIIEELTDLVEEAVLAEFDRLTERGGVLGAMERMYQRNKIQEESLYYEHLKHSGELPIIGVNAFLNKKGSPTTLPGEVIRSSAEEKEQQIRNLLNFRERNKAKAPEALKRLQERAIKNENIFEELMETVKYCSLGQITNALYEVGGQYRRNM
ncbi:MAG TPA: methylmalonyl-CoA mutase family protein [Flavitalea sp.]|nr:methylmalonyl-CoA mutase family protein [Flavitalea sp.]